MSDSSYSAAICHLLLAGSSAVSIQLLRSSGGDYKWAYGALGLYFVKSCLGVVRFGNPEYGGKVRTTYKHFFFLSTTFGLPCIATNLYLYHSYKWSTALLHVGFTILPVTAYIIDNRMDDMVDDMLRIVTVGNIISLCWLGYVKENYYAMATAVCYGINFFGVRRSWTMSDIPTLDLFIIGLCFFNFFSFHALTD